METYKATDPVLETIRICWYNSLILNQIHSSQSGVNFIQEFSDKHMNGINFNSWNQGAILQALYGLFVLPKEYWRNKIRNGENLSDEDIDELVFSFLPENFNLENYFQIEYERTAVSHIKRFGRLRNSIAHGGIVFQDNLFVFNSYSNKRNETTGEYPLLQKLTSDMSRTTKFIQVIGSYFINNLENSKNDHKL